MRFFNWVLAAVLMTAALAGCKKSSSEDSAQAASAPRRAPVPETVARIHWMGAKGLLAHTNAASLKKIWDLPETAKLATQTLDKLSLGLVHGWPDLPATNRITLVTNYPSLLATNKAALALRPLLQDLMEQESFLEVRHVTNQPGDLVLAVRLEEARASLWATNLSTVIQMLTGVLPQPIQSNSLNWSCVVTNSPWSRSSALRHIEITRSGQWTLLGFSSETNQLLNETVARIQQPGGTGTPAPATETNYWIEASADLPRLSTALQLGWNLPHEIPKFWLAVTGQGEEVLTRGNLTFTTPLPNDLPAWNIPTNLIQDPLHSFTAVRGIGSWLSAQPFWKELQVGEAPNQFFTWCRSGSPFLDFFAAPLNGASNAVVQIGNRLMQAANPTLSSNRMGVLELSTNSTGIVWSKVPIISPFLKLTQTDGGEFIEGALVTGVVTNSPPPEGTLNELLSRTNLVYYDREITGPRIEAWMYISQLFRIVARRPQLAGDCVPYQFLKAVLPTVGPTKTFIERTGPSEVSILRTSTLGLTAAEMHMLAEWEESPLFPVGFHSGLTKLPPLPPRRGVAAPLPSNPK